jgi:hypothetical protein
MKRSKPLKYMPPWSHTLSANKLMPQIPTTTTTTTTMVPGSSSVLSPEWDKWASSLNKCGGEINIIVVTFNICILNCHTLKLLLYINRWADSYFSYSFASTMLKCVCNFSHMFIHIYVCIMLIRLAPTIGTW